MYLRTISKYLNIPLWINCRTFYLVSHHLRVHTYTYIQTNIHTFSNSFKIQDSYLCTYIPSQVSATLQVWLMKNKMIEI